MAEKEGLFGGMSTRTLILIGSGIGCVILILAAIMDHARILNIPGKPLHYAIISVLVATGPYGFYEDRRIKNIKSIERHLPDFLRDVAEASRFGMTLADAIVVASSGRYGRLTKEIRKMAAQIEWGVPVAEALRLFAERVNTPLVNRVVSIVVKASEAGGNIADVLNMVSHNVLEMQLMERERKIQMSTYVMVIYIAFVVFLVTVIIMSKTFLPKMQEAGASIAEASAAGGALAGATLIHVEVIDKILFLLVVSAVLHAIGDGIIAGVLQEGKAIRGLKHTFFMVIIAFFMIVLLIKV